MKREKAKKISIKTAKECAYIAVFVALVIAAQLVLAALPGIEVVTVLFISYSFVFGACRGGIAAVAFAFLRQLVFPFSETVLILYLVYFPLLGGLFGFLGHWVKKPLFSLWWLLPIAVACTAAFNLFDGWFTPLWYGMQGEAARAYFISSLPFMLPQLACTAVSMLFLFVPLQRAFRLIKKGL
ncbi:MAG: hypothetical protein IJF44_04925 [Clostridia bacterium]|nr:hypothetical protein [Clostridia bacterium]